MAGLARPVANRSAPQITAALRDCGAARKRGRHTSSAEPFQALHVPSDSGAEKVIFCAPPMHISLPRTYVDKPKIARNGVDLCRDRSQALLKIWASKVSVSRLEEQWPRGVTVSTLDSESSDRGSNPREASFSMPSLARPSTIHCSIHQPHILHPSSTPPSRAGSRPRFGGACASAPKGIGWRNE